VELLPKLRRLLCQDTDIESARTDDLDILDAATRGPIIAVWCLFD
jgi:hypothetical protein